MTSPLGFTVYPYLRKGSVVMQWNAVIYDLRLMDQNNVRGQPQYRFIKRTPVCDSPDAARGLATLEIQRMLKL